MRGGLKTYNQSSVPSRIYFTATIGTSADCRLIQQKKDELLVSLAQYFAKEIEKEAFANKLTTIKSDLLEKCPTYVPRVGCC